MTQRGFERVLGRNRFNMRALQTEVWPSLEADTGLKPGLRSLRKKLSPAQYDKLAKALLRNAFLIKLVKLPKVETTRVRPRWYPRLRNDQRFSSFADCLNIVNDNVAGEVQLALVCTTGHTGAPLPLWTVMLEPLLTRPELEQEVGSQVGVTDVILGDINENEISAQGLAHGVTTTFMCGDVHPVGFGDGDDDVLDALRKLKIAVGLVTPSERELIAGDIHPQNNPEPDGDGDAPPAASDADAPRP